MHRAAKRSLLQPLTHRTLTLVEVSTAECFLRHPEPMPHAGSPSIASCEGSVDHSCYESVSQSCGSESVKRCHPRRGATQPVPVLVRLTLLPRHGSYR